MKLPMMYSGTHPAQEGIMSTSLLNLFGLATIPPQALSRFTAARQERPRDNDRNRKQRQRQEEEYRPDAADNEQIGSHIDTSV